MSQSQLNENKNTEFDSLWAESISNSKLKEGSIIKGIVLEIEDEAIIVDIGAKARESKREFAFQKNKMKFLMTKLMFI